MYNEELWKNVFDCSDMTREEKETFYRIFENSLNGIDPDSLTTNELLTQWEWVNENYDELKGE